MMPVSFTPSPMAPISFIRKIRSSLWRRLPVPQRSFRPDPVRMKLTGIGAFLRTSQAAKQRSGLILGAHWLLCAYLRDAPIDDLDIVKGVLPALGLRSNLVRV
jgi:hypothetical protein